MNISHWPLEVLSKAIHYKNLTTASENIGISQPQLSRIIKKIEEDLNMVILDRSAKRKSSWTEDAKKISQIYSANQKELLNSLESLQESYFPDEISIGTLEGLVETTIDVAQKILNLPSVKTVHYNIFDQDDLNRKFISSELDLAFVSKIPGRQKLKHQQIFGYQELNTVEMNSNYSVFSQFEFGRLNKKTSNKSFVSNSLFSRMYWLKNYGGVGSLPSSISSRKTKTSFPLYLIGKETLSPSLWKEVSSLLPKTK